MEAEGPPMPVEQTETFSPEQCGDGGAAAGVAGQDHIAADFTLGAVDMIETFQFMHDDSAP